MLKRLAAALALVMLGAPGAAAEDLPITAFAGHFVGTGMARTDLSEYFNMTVRDLDVIIAPREGGFAINWTTVLREGGVPEAPNVTRKANTLYFVPAGRPGVFRGTPEADPLSGQAFAWAYIKGQTLTIHSLVVAADGSYEMQTYDRTLTGFAMELTFSRVENGRAMRQVTGRLIKTAD